MVLLCDLFLFSTGARHCVLLQQVNNVTGLILERAFNNNLTLSEVSVDLKQRPITAKERVYCCNANEIIINLYLSW